MATFASALACSGAPEARDTAAQAGVATRQLSLGDIGWNAGRASFVDADEDEIRAASKLYPWERMVDEEVVVRLLSTAG